MRLPDSFFFFFFNDTATTEIYTLSLHDALPICRYRAGGIDPLRERLFTYPVLHYQNGGLVIDANAETTLEGLDRKSTRLNSSHSQISYAVFCLKKKKTSTVA